MKFIRYFLIASAVLFCGTLFLDFDYHPLHRKLRDVAARLADVPQSLPEVVQLEPFGARVCFTWPGTADPEGLLFEALVPPASARRIGTEVIARGGPKDWHVGLLSADGTNIELFKFSPRFFGEVDWADNLKVHFLDQSGQPKAACLRSLSMIPMGISARVDELKLAP
ncbi:MAG: hypothetical protein NWR47_03285 [Aestuariivirgaceae bacterium]|nr:hypothetical protein [Aestuariivirgaceae bacterium]